MSTSWQPKATSLHLHCCLPACSVWPCSAGLQSPRQLIQAVCTSRSWRIGSGWPGQNRTNPERFGGTLWWRADKWAIAISAKGSVVETCVCGRGIALCMYVLAVPGNGHGWWAAWAAKVWTRLGRSGAAQHRRLFGTAAVAS